MQELILHYKWTLRVICCSAFVAVAGKVVAAVPRFTGARIEGQVIDAQYQKGLLGVTVALHKRDSFLTMTQASPQGRFSFSVAEYSKYHLTACKTGFLPTSTDIERVQLGTSDVPPLIQVTLAGVRITPELKRQAQVGQMKSGSRYQLESIADPMKACSPVFSISKSNDIEITAGESGVASITTTGWLGFNGSMALSVTGVPPGATASFSPQQMNGVGTSILTVSTTAAVHGAPYRLTITGTSGAFTRTVVVKVAVANFTLGADNANMWIARGGAGKNTIALSSSGAFNSSVSFSVTGLPDGATATFTPTKRNGTGTTSMVVTTGGADLGSYPLRVSGTSGALVQSIRVFLTIK